MRKILMLFTAVVVAAMVAGCTSCGGDKMKDSKGFDSIPAVTHGDTMRVLKETRAFMQALRGGDVDHALDMLSEMVDGEAFPLMDSVKTRYKKQFTMWPVLDFEVETSKIERSDYATATYRYRFMDNPTKDPNYPCYMRVTIEERIEGSKCVLVLHDFKKLVGPYGTASDLKP